MQRSDLPNRISIPNRLAEDVIIHFDDPSPQPLRIIRSLYHRMAFHSKRTISKVYGKVAGMVGRLRGASEIDDGEMIEMASLENDRPKSMVDEHRMVEDAQ